MRMLGTRLLGGCALVAVTSVMCAPSAHAVTVSNGLLVGVTPLSGGRCKLDFQFDFVTQDDAPANPGSDAFHVRAFDVNGASLLFDVNDISAPGTGFYQGSITVDFSNPVLPIDIVVDDIVNSGGGYVKGPRLPVTQITSAPSACIPNAAPLADAGSDQTNVIPGSLVTLDGTASTDPDNDTLTYTWTQISGPSVVLDDATSPTPSFSAPGGASTTPVVFQLVVNDGTVNSAPVTVTVSMQDNIGTAQAQIGEFLAQRNAILLSNQPDLQRRIDRLNGAGQGSNAGSLVSALAPMNDRMPLSVFAAQGRVQASSSLAQASGSAPRGVAGSWDIWAEARFIDTDFAAREGTATLFYAGIDNAVSDNLLLGLMGQYDELDAKGSVTTGVLDGEGWMVGPYATLRLADRLFLDARAAYGETRNRISPFGTYTDVFDTDRLLLAGTLTGEFEPAPGLVIRPEAAIIWIDEEQKAYIDSLGSPIAAQGLDAGQLSFAPRVMYSAKVDDQFTLRPFVEARGIYSFGDGASAVLGDDTRLRVEGGLDLLGANGLRIGLSGFHDGIGNGGFSATGARLSVGFTF